MDFLKTGLKSVISRTPQAGSQSAGAEASETVDRLVDRVQTSTLLTDRRDAVRALKSLSRKFRLEVGAQSMDVLITILETDNDAEMIGYTLDTLANVTSPEPIERDDDSAIQDDPNLGGQFTEIFIKKADNVSLVLSFMMEYDFQVRWPAVRLLTNLLIHRPRDMQEIILVSPMGVSRLMDLLADSREVIRNDGLLLLSHLTKGNANIQKIVAFENAFDRLLEILSEEGMSDGGIVVEDCLIVLLNLLKNNSSNQNFFKEGSYIQRLVPYFDIQTEGQSEEEGWSAQKVSNVHLMLQVVRTLVSPSNSHQVTSSCQKLMNSCGILEKLCTILMASGVPADILTETLNTVSEVIRGHHNNQEFFATVTAPCSPPRAAIVVLLMSMVNEKQPFVLRCAVLYCFQCFLYKNELGQAQIIQTLLPTSADVSTVTAGQLLCGGLLSLDALSNWCAAISLSHALVENSAQKEQLLRVQLATGVNCPHVSLLQQCSTLLQMSNKVQTRMGLLQLLCTWLAFSPLAVQNFLKVPTNVPFLTSQVGLTEGDELETLVQALCAFLLGICIQFNDDSVHEFSKDALCQLISKRLGLESFHNKLNIVSKHDSYTQAAQRPQLKRQQPSDLIFDYEFCRLFKSLEGSIIKAVTPSPKGPLPNGPESGLTDSQCNLLQQYKDLIREQDQQLNELRRQHEDIQTDHTKLLAQVDEMSQTEQQLRDQNALLKAHKGGQASMIASDSSQLQQDVDTLKHQLEQLKLQSIEKDSTIEKLKAESGIESSTVGSGDGSEIHSESETIASYVSRINELELKLAEAENKVPVASDNNDTQRQDLEKQVQELDDKLKTLESERALAAEEAQGKLDTLQLEHEDLLVLLTEQDEKIKQFKQRLIALGEKFDDDEDDKELSDDSVEA